MGEIIFVLIIASMCAAAFGLLAYMLHRWSIRSAKRTTLRLIAAGSILAGIAGMIAVFIAPLPSQVGELLFFVCAVEILVMLGLLAASYRETRDDELARMIADDL